MNKNPLLVLEAFGQSVWLDNLSRKLLMNGEIQRLIDQDGVSGLTTNPSIFEKAISESQDYDDAIQTLTSEGKSVDEIYQALTVEDIQHAADLFRPVYDQMKGADGFVSLEVSPNLAHDTAGTISEARLLWSAVNRPNLFIKVPATREGLPAIQQLIGEGINVNVTLIFGLPRYREVAEAYVAGLETLAAQGRALEHVSSVASLFLSRIDVLIDDLLEKKAGSVNVEGLPGQVAIASAKTAYRIYQGIISGERFQKLAQKGAHPQHLLWASTGTKNPKYSDVKYVEALIGRETINTMPPETLDAYRDHGQPALRLENGLLESNSVMEGMREVGIDLDATTQRLEDEGLAKFSQAFEHLTTALLKKRSAAAQEDVKHSFAN
jgi:transaldolase